MIRRCVTSYLGALAVLGLLAGCDGASTPQPTDDSNTVTVTTMTPRQQLFHDTIEAIGTAVGDPNRARTLSLAHGGQVVSVAANAGQRVQRGATLLTISPDPTTHQAFQQAPDIMIFALPARRVQHDGRRQPYFLGRVRHGGEQTRPLAERNAGIVPGERGDHLGRRAGPVIAAEIHASNPSISLRF